MDLALWKIVYSKGNLRGKILGVLRGHGRRLRDIFRIRNYDLVYVFMWVTPFGTPALEWLTRKFAKRLIYDVEDNVLVEQNLSSAQNPNPLAALLKSKAKTKLLIAQADHVISSSPFLNDYCLKLNHKKACTYISSSVDTDRFLPATPYKNDKTVVIGWTGTYSSKVFLELLENVWKRLAQRVKFKLLVIGNFTYSIPGIDLEMVQWTAEHEVRDLQRFDIGVYPLPIDEWVLGKSGLKAIQYMAFGLPCVATKVGTTPLLIENGVNGILVESEDEWVEALEQLIKDAKARKKIGQAARKDAVENYSLHAIAQDYDLILQQVMKD
jgi:glycosyltransferase involved in cell wall biosynthesis